MYIAELAWDRHCRWLLRIFGRTDAHVTGAGILLKDQIVMAEVLIHVVK